MVLDNVRQYVAHLQSGSLHLLGDEAGDSHSRRGVDFEQVNLVNRFAVAANALADDVVNADDAVAVEDVVDIACEFGYTLSRFLAEACRSDFLNLTVVFCVIVEELVVGDNLRGWQYNRLCLGLVASDGSPFLRDIVPP